ncbi:MAG: LptA/OstA family protein [Kiritimatiellia bacterium]|jgi:lipopolysaccharide export system protein LptA
MTKRARLIFALMLALPAVAAVAADAAATKTIETVITSESLAFDYENFMASFLRNVRVVDPEFQLTADAMTVRFKNTNDIDRLELEGHVKLQKDDVEAACGSAFYTKVNGQVLMEKSPVVTRGDSRISGDKMSVWIPEERVLVERRVKVDTKGRRGVDRMTVAANRLEFDYREFRATFEGNVVVKEPGFSLHADRILVFLENTNDVKRMDAAGRVQFTRDAVAVTCGKASYSRDSGVVILQEKPVVSHGTGRIEADRMSIWIHQKRFVVEDDVRLLSGVADRPKDPPTTVTASKLEFDYDKFIALFDGGARVKHPEMTLEADRMRVFLENTNRLSRVDAVGRVHLRSDGQTSTPKRGGSRRGFDLVADNMLAHFADENVLDRVEAEGGVNLKSGDLVGQCGQAVYTGSDKRIRMQGNPVVTKGDNKFAATVMSYLIDEGRVFTEEEFVGEILPDSFKEGGQP